MTAKLPYEFKRYFWDVDFESIDPSEKSRFVINRLLDKGDISAAKWVKSTYSSDQITEVLKTSADFSPRTVSFWGLLYDIPLSQLRCLSQPFQTMRKTLWPY